jgi:hypothetical protein
LGTDIGSAMAVDAHQSSQQGVLVPGVPDEVADTVDTARLPATVVGIGNSTADQYPGIQVEHSLEHLAVWLHMDLVGGDRAHAEIVVAGSPPAQAAAA